MKKKGLTLVEMIIVLALMSIIGLAAMNFFSVELNIYGDQNNEANIKNDERAVTNYLTQDIRGTDATNSYNSTSSSYTSNIIWGNSNVISTTLGLTSTNNNYKMFLQKKNNTAVLYDLESGTLKRSSYTVNYSYNFDATTRSQFSNNNSNLPYIEDSTIKTVVGYGNKENIQDYLPYINNLNSLNNGAEVYVDAIFNSTGSIIMVYHIIDSNGNNVYYQIPLIAGSVTYSNPTETDIANNVSNFVVNELGGIATDGQYSTNKYPTYSIAITFNKKDGTTENIDVTESEINYGGHPYDTN